MTDFVKFIQEYGVYILTFLCFVIEIVFIFIKRKPKSIDDFLYCLNEIRVLLPEFITRVECPGNGDVKKASVLKASVSLMSDKLGRKLTELESEIVLSMVSSDIESILSTPTKKGENNEK